MKPTTRARLHNSARSVLMSNYTRSRHMTAKTDLPPLPERFDCTNGSAQWCYGCYTMTRDDLGDYVLAEDYDALRNASEALQAEAEALLAEVAEWKGIAVAQSAEIERLQAEVETGDYNWNRFIEPINSYFVYKPGFVIRPESARESEGGPYASHPCGAAKNIMCYVDALEDRAERLAEALRLIESAKDRGFGIDYARGVAQRALLRDQEGGQ